MDHDFDVITDLMNSLADARVTLNACLYALAGDDTPTRQHPSDTLRQEIAATITGIEVSRLKVLKRLTPEV
jgi:hypothetical protein